MRYKIIDLFAGAGGLSLGFEQTNKCEIVVAFEKNKNAKKTYIENHPHVAVFGDICEADFQEIRNKYGRINIVVGGPPCQGFSNANRQKNHTINQNNMLVKEYIRAVTEIDPDCFLLENVSMLKSDVHRFFVSDGDNEMISHYNIPIKQSSICLLEEKFSFNSAIRCVKDKEMISSSLWPMAQYRVLNTINRFSNNDDKMKYALSRHKSEIQAIICKDCRRRDYIGRVEKVAMNSLKDYYGGIGSLDTIKRTLKPAIKIQRMLCLVKELNDNKIVIKRYINKHGLYAVVDSYSVIDYIKKTLSSNDAGYTIESGVLCAADYGVPQKRKRFIMIGVKGKKVLNSFFPEKILNEEEYHTVRDAISDLENSHPYTNVGDDIGIFKPITDKQNWADGVLRDSPIIMNHVVTDSSPIVLNRFKNLNQGENFHSLDEALKKDTYTDYSRTQNTIYLRLDYDKPSETVVNVRKSMWIHPTLDRAISIREAARLQTFPDSFVFHGPKDSQYQQVGNAVPPLFAKILAESVISTLDKTRR